MRNVVRSPLLVGIMLAVALGLGVSAPPALAASTATARATATLPVYDGPGRRFEVIGKLPAESRVHLLRCTRKSAWCLIILDGEPAGWVLGSYLVGSPAKLEVTPSDLFEDSPFGLLFPRSPRLPPP